VTFFGTPTKEEVLQAAKVFLYALWRDVLRHFCWLHDQLRRGLVRFYTPFGVTFFGTLPPRAGALTCGDSAALHTDQAGTGRNGWALRAFGASVLVSAQAQLRA
jgi:hypothetical protein